MRRRSTLSLLVCLFAIGCGGPADEEAAQSASEGEESATCPSTAPAPSPLPRIEAEQRTLAYWLERVAADGPLDAPLLTPADIVDQNIAIRRDPSGSRALAPTLAEPVPAADALHEANERVAAMRALIAEGVLVDADGDAPSLDTFAAVDALRPDGTVRRATAPVALRCGPLDGPLYKEPIDPAFDRNLCSRPREGEPIAVLGVWPNGMRLARTRYALGFLAADAPLSPPIDPATLPIDEAPAAPLTRRAVLTEAFRHLGSPYGWGGYEGGRDCSRFLLDVFGASGVELPRNSARQAVAGTFTIDVGEVASRDERTLLLAAAARSGLVLLHFPGHIMLYLGQTEDGVPMAIHAFSEYVEPCPGGGETLRRVDRVEVTDLRLGEGSSRKSFLERLTTLTVLGRPARPELRGAAVFRPSPAPVVAADAACEDSADAWITTSPAAPQLGVPVRVIVATTADPAPATLALYGPDGARIEATVDTLGGPPFGYVATLPSPSAGSYTAVLGDAQRVVACERFAVAPGAQGPLPHVPGAPAWLSSWRWERDTENLYALFVEHLFRSTDGETRTWSELTEVLRDPSRNLLYDYRAPGEDEALRLHPDCADLPYLLRAYFAWKLRLPYAYRRCSRGRAGVAPSCGAEVETNLTPIDAATDVDAFRAFTRGVANAVHSASARTRPTSDDTDFYPVALSRETLPPGTVFADPYGHLLVVAQWRPQGVLSPGVMLAADAQPDATVAQRVFWRGTFLFRPETTEAGAGFKAFRPIVGRGEDLRVLTNDEIGRAGGVYPLSLEQYEGSADDFYDRVDALTNPRALPPARVLDSLVAALDESARRRVLSVQLGEDYVRANPSVIAMPTGHAIFETRGPWEDFATPSRDMRLLISIDAVAGFPDAVTRRPARFGVAPEDVERTETALRDQLARALAAHRITYQRSNGEPAELSLAELVARASALELAYNPNDCIERRWGAPEGSDEAASCARSAPSAQRARMEQYRAWFRERTRPPR